MHAEMMALTCLLTKRASQRRRLMVSHSPDGLRVFITCTSVASNNAKHTTYANAHHPPIRNVKKPEMRS